MADRTIAPLIPPKVTHEAGRQRLAARNARLNVTELFAPPHAGSLVYGLGSIDTLGRGVEPSTVDAPGWTTGDRLHIGLHGGSVVAHRDETGALVAADGVAL